MKIIDPKTREEKQVIISVDDGIRPDTSMSVLAKLKPAFKKDGSTTAGIRGILCEFSEVSLILTLWILTLVMYLQAMLVK